VKFTAFADGSTALAVGIREGRRQATFIVCRLRCNALFVVIFEKVQNPPAELP